MELLSHTGAYLLTSLRPASRRIRVCFTRSCLAVCLLGSGCVLAQTLPATLPTASAAGIAPDDAARSTGIAPGPARHRARVTLQGNQLEVRADNSSLNQILLEISQLSGMKITGGVQDQRVYGTYGPGPASDVLSALLEDTGANVLLKMTPSDGLAELILSPRSGGPTPPSPAVYRPDPADAQAALIGQTASAASATAVASPNSSAQVPQQVPAQSAQPAPSGVPPLPFSQPPAQPAATDPFVTPQTPPPSGIVSAPTIAPATEPGTTPGPTTQNTGESDQPSPTTGSTGQSTGSGTTNPQSPNGVKTPQQIYQELQKLLQQQSQPAQSGSPQ